LRQLEVDWNALHSAFQMNMPEVRCFFCVEEGTVVKVPPGDQSLPTIRSQPERYFPIEAVPSRIQYQWLDGFIKMVEDEAVRGRMEAAINGKGAFRRFKDILLTLPDERRRWFEYRDVAMRQRIVEWVREKGVEATNAPEWSSSSKPSAEVSNRSQDIEALRDFLIDWVDGKPANDAVTPLALEDLARAIGEVFKVRPTK